MSHSRNCRVVLCFKPLNIPTQSPKLAAKETLNHLKYVRAHHFSDSSVVVCSKSDPIAWNPFRPILLPDKLHNIRSWKLVNTLQYLQCRDVQQYFTERRASALADVLITQTAWSVRRARRKLHRSQFQAAFEVGTQFRDREFFSAILSAVLTNKTYGR